MKAVKTFSIICILLSGCTTMSTYDFPDAGEIDSGNRMPTMNCSEDTIVWDFSNCGECGNSCDAANADRCFDGQCMCGLSPVCEDGADCRFGRCVAPDVMGDNDCEFDEDCDVNSACIEGYCTFIRCIPEICDGIDNDCDGVVDGTVSGPLAEWCYSGAATSPLEINLPCRPGIRVCIDQEWTECEGEVPPIDEVGLLACNGRDDNCDLCIDGDMVEGMCVFNPPVLFDVLFLYDTSGSMERHTDQSRMATFLFSDRLSSNPSFNWGIGHVPGLEMDGVASLYHDLSDFESFQRVLLAGWVGNRSVEPQWDSVYQSLNGDLGVSWREGSVKIIILMTDEPGIRPGHSMLTNEEGMCEEVVNTGAVLFVVARFDDLEDFDDCAFDMEALPTSGNSGSLIECDTSGDCPRDLGEECRAGYCVSPEVILLADRLDEVISDPCGE